MWGKRDWIRRKKDAGKCGNFDFDYFGGCTDYICNESYSFFGLSKGKEIPETIQYLGKVLTPAVIGMLVVYCLKSTPVREAPHGVPELIAVATVAALHVWKRNNLLSIGAGTVLYMFLIQVVF